LSLNIMSFPLGKLPDRVFSDILKGAAEKSIEAGVVIGGGHSVTDKELKFGQAVIGYVNNNQIVDNSHAKAGDLIIITKPIGIGIITTAMKMGGKVKAASFKQAVRVMECLNKDARDIMVKNKISCGTDITGFGLLGHLYEIASASNVTLEIKHDSFDIIEGAFKLAEDGFFPGGAYNNLEYIKKFIKFKDGIDDVFKLLMCDPQTSGGIAMFVSPQRLTRVQSLLNKMGLCHSVIGSVSHKTYYHISVI